MSFFDVYSFFFFLDVAPTRTSTFIFDDNKIFDSSLSMIIVNEEQC